MILILGISSREYHHIHPAQNADMFIRDSLNKILNTTASHLLGCANEILYHPPAVLKILPWIGKGIATTRPFLNLLQPAAHANSLTRTVPTKISPQTHIRRYKQPAVSHAANFATNFLFYHTLRLFVILWQPGISANCLKFTNLVEYLNANSCPPPQNPPNRLPYHSAWGPKPLNLSQPPLSSRCLPSASQTPLFHPTNNLLTKT